MRRHLDSPRLKPRTSPYSHVVIAGHDCFVAGIVAADIPGGDAVIGDVEAETDFVMRTILDILADHGMDVTDLVRVDVHLLDLDEIHVMDRAYGRHLDRRTMPARTTTQSDKLYGGSRVEITCMARRR
jgi:2-iminobutanoate/2-iminopropanoate deaminase